MTFKAPCSAELLFFQDDENLPRLIDLYQSRMSIRIVQNSKAVGLATVLPGRPNDVTCVDGGIEGVGAFEESFDLNQDIDFCQNSVQRERMMMRA